jgi:branched-chain amino acid transport system ATP-binding protein
LRDVLPRGHLRLAPALDENVMTMLSIQHLDKAFGSLVVSSDINLSVGEGQRHVIIGPNGAGKTTLINQIGGQIQPDSGRIILAGRDVTMVPAYERARAGLARTFQKNTLFASLTVFENIRLGAQAVYGQRYNLVTNASRRVAINARAARMIEQMRLSRIAYSLVANLSYGDLRQVEVAVALSTDPKLLLLDEPTSGLSPSETHEMIELIKKLPEDMSILMIEHDMEVVFSIADYITVLYYGEVLAGGPPTEVAANARVQEVYLGDTP